MLYVSFLNGLLDDVQVYKLRRIWFLYFEAFRVHSLLAISHGGLWWISCLDCCREDIANIKDCIMLSLLWQFCFYTLWVAFHSPKALVPFVIYFLVLFSHLWLFIQSKREYERQMADEEAQQLQSFQVGFVSLAHIL